MHASGDDPIAVRVSMIRLFGALEIVGRRTHARPARSWRSSSEATARDPARGARAPRSDRPDRRADLGCPSSRTTSPLRSRRSSRFCGAAWSPTATARAQLVVTEAEAYRFATDAVDLDLDRFDELLERSAREPTRIARHSLEQALSLVRGEVLEDEPYAPWAQDLRGSYQGRVLGARLDAADAALAELDFAAALAHAEAAVALDRFSERAQRLSMLALYALGREHEALGRYRALPHPARRGARSRANRRNARTRSRPHPPGRCPLASAAPDQRNARSRRRKRSVRLVGRTSELDDRRWSAIATRTRSAAVTLIQIEGDDRPRQDPTARRAARAARRRPDRTRDLLAARTAPALRAARGRASRGTRGRRPRCRTPAALCSRSCPSSPSARRCRPLDEIEVLEALVALIAEHAPLVLLLDDLHLADHRTLAALGYLRRRATTPGRDRDDRPAHRAHRRLNRPTSRRRHAHPAGAAFTRRACTARDCRAARGHRRRPAARRRGASTRHDAEPVAER